MKKSHIIFVLIILLSLSLVDARDILKISGNPKCFNNGTITFDVDNPYEDVLLTDKIEMWAKYLGFVGEKSYKISGSWSLPSVYTKNEFLTKSPATFTSS